MNCEKNKFFPVFHHFLSRGKQIFPPWMWADDWGKWTPSTPRGKTSSLLSFLSQVLTWDRGYNVCSIEHWIRLSVSGGLFLPSPEQHLQLVSAEQWQKLYLTQWQHHGPATVLPQEHQLSGHGLRATVMSFAAFIQKQHGYLTMVLLYSGDSVALL